MNSPTTTLQPSYITENTDVVVSSEVDRFPVSGLLTRYNIAKTALYDRLNAVGIVPFKEGRLSWVSNEALEILDRLNSHLETGGKLEDFKGNKVNGSNSKVRESKETYNYKSKPEIQHLAAIKNTSISNLDINNFDWQLIYKLATEIVDRLDPNRKLKALQEIVDKGWVVPTSKLKELLGSVPSLKQEENSFVRGNFQCVKVCKLGRETGWKINVKDVHE